MSSQTPDARGAPWRDDVIAAATDRQLFAGLATILRELRSRGLIRSQKILGDYAEALVAELLGSTQAESGAQTGYDLTLDDGTRIQVKSRQATATSQPTHYGDFADLEGNPFDQFVGVILDEDFRVVETLKTSIDRVRALSRPVHGKQRLMIAALRNDAETEQLDLRSLQEP